MVFYQSRDIQDFRPVIRGLAKEFDNEHLPAILEWCGYLDSDPEQEGMFWEIWLVKEDSEAVGICGLYSLNKSTEELWLGWLGVLPSQRKKGIGNAILCFLFDKARSLGCKRIYCWTDKDKSALGFYIKHGFQLLGTIRNFQAKVEENAGLFSCDQDDLVVCKELFEDLDQAIRRTRPDWKKCIRLWFVRLGYRTGFYKKEGFSYGCCYICGATAPEEAI